MDIEKSRMFQAVRISILELFEFEMQANVAPRAIDLARDIIIGDKQFKFPEDFANFDFLIVAYSSRNGYDEWAAYSGVPEGSKSFNMNMSRGLNMNNMQVVAENGSKLHPATAKLIFPEFETKGFRYRL